MEENKSTNVGKLTPTKLIYVSILLVLLVVCLVLYLVQQKSSQSVEQVVTLTTKSSPTTGTSATPTSGTATTSKLALYGGKENEDVELLIDLETGSTKTFLPEGYAIRGATSYPNNPKYLFLEKSNELYIYTVATAQIRKVNLEQFGKNTLFSFNLSLTEDDKAFISVLLMEPESGEDDFYGSDILDAQHYFLDLAANQLSDVTNTKVTDKLVGCYEYDSKYNRFITWQCGEGVGSAAPISSYSISNGEAKTIVAGDDKGVDFLAAARTIIVTTYGDETSGGDRYPKSLTKLILDKDIIQEEYVFDSSVKQKTADTGYSALFIPEKNMLAMGGSQNVVLFSYSNDKKIVSAEVFEEKDIYANHLFSDGSKLYYVSGSIYDKNQTALRIIDLGTKKIENTFRLPNFIESGLITLPQ